MELSPVRVVLNTQTNGKPNKSYVGMFEISSNIYSYSAQIHCTVNALKRPYLKDLHSFGSECLYFNSFLKVDDIERCKNVFCSKVVWVIRMPYNQSFADNDILFYLSHNFYDKLSYILWGHNIQTLYLFSMSDHSVTFKYFQLYG